MKKRSLEDVFNLNNLLYLVALVIALSLSWNTVKVIERNYSLEQEVDALEEEIAILSLENENLKYNIAYYETDDYLEVVAKEKFNKRAAGERVAVFEKDDFQPTKTALNADIPEEPDQEPDYKENFSAWWDFLFNNDPS
ncbi:MAG: septum formation initiator family protein [Candidatus Saccharimonadales bacterium]|nr:septum formation initiator family protein [Candidatus Saccharimonadales bacterium]